MTNTKDEEARSPLEGIAPKILLVSDRPESGPMFVYALIRKNIQVVETNMEKAIERWEEHVPDLILIDTQKPEENILVLIRRLRAETITPILLLIHAAGEDQVLDTYHAGVDECILKPIGPGLIVAKVRAWLRRTRAAKTDVVENVRVNQFTLLVAERKLLIGARAPIKLTNLELRLLHLLMSRSPRAFTHEEITQRVWEDEGDTDYAALKNMVYRLRQKIEADPTQPRYLLTMPGQGYKFVTE